MAIDKNRNVVKDSCAAQEYIDEAIKETKNPNYFKVNHKDYHKDLSGRNQVW